MTVAANHQPTQRLAWIDFAKGVCIVLVVLYHCAYFIDDHDTVNPHWLGLVEFVGPIRMPTFYFASGLLAHKILSLSWAAVTIRRLIPLAWVYVLWVPLRYLFFTTFPDTAVTEEVNSPWNMLRQLYIPMNAMWFIYGLIIFTVLARLFRHVPGILHVGVAFGIAIGFTPAISYIGDHLGLEIYWTWTSIASLYGFFLLGLIASNRVKSLSRQLPQRPWLLTALLLIIGMLFCVDYTGIRLIPFPLTDVQHSVWFFSTRILGVLLGVIGSIWLTQLIALRLPSAATLCRPLQWLGRNTLQIFLMHEAAVASLCVILAHYGAFGSSRFTLVAPAIVTATSIMICLVIHRVTDRSIGRFLYTAPINRLVTRLELDINKRDNPAEPQP